MNDDNQLNAELLPPGPYEPARRLRRNGHSHLAYSGSDVMNERQPRESRPAREPAPAIIDPLSFVEMLMQRWRWLVLGGCLMAAVAALGGMILWRSSCTAVAQLIRYEPIGVGDFFKAPLLTPDTFSGILKSPELLQRVATNAQPPISAEVLAKSVFIKPEIDSDLVKVGVKGKNAQSVVNLANLYAEEAVRFTRELQKREMTELNKNYLKQQLGSMDQDLNTLQEQFKTLPSSGLVTSKLTEMHGTVSNLTQQLLTSPRATTMSARLYDRLTREMESLSDLTKVYSDANPKVQQQQALVEKLQHQYSEATTNSTMGGMGALDAAGGPLGFNPAYEVIRGKLQALHNSRELLADRQREAQSFAANPPGNVRTFAPATLKGVVRDRRWLKVGIVSIFGGLLGIMFAGGGVLLVEIMDDRLKTSEDLKRVTRLPVIATLDDLGRKGPSARERWAFRTWTMLQGRLSPSSNQGLVCGVTSSQEGEGRSTWINLLAEAASLSGFRVLTIATRPSANGGEEPGQIEGHNPGENPNGADSNSNTLTTNVLASPAAVTEQLAGPNPQPLVHIPLPGWVWNLERRLQWQDALNHWRKIDNVVILVELPPASTPEAVLLGQNLPNLVWLANSGTARAAETRAQLETLRHARCNLVGAVLNHELAPPLKSRFPRWLGCLMVSLALSIRGAGAQPTNTPITETPVPAPSLAPAVPGTNGSFSVLTPTQRGDWQKRLTLGPGDILSFSLYGQPELTKADVFVAPDGRVGFLEAQNILAAGLTVDELRTNLDQELSKYRRSPRTVITPILYQSKKYYMLGKVVARGTYTLDRPITIVEAVARAHGLETALSDRNTLDLADFQKSFLMRKGQRIPVNFENLFEHGDLSQNVALEPDDYLYFPAAALKEVYVLGEVQFPGVVTYTPELTVIGALSARGGFNTRAYKSRVLIVRGSLANPEHLVVDTKAILDARGQNVRLQPKDIIYVSSRPFIRVEELADLAVTAFIQSVTAEWTGRNIGPLIQRSFIPAP